MIKNQKFTREYINSDGSKDVWTYDLTQFKNGPTSVEIIYPKKYQHISEQNELDNSQLPLTQRKWVNPVNGKEVGYTRAKNLGLI
jgi:hypothetical protein